MTRKEELEAVFADLEEKPRMLVSQVIEETVFLEERLSELKKLPFLRSHPARPELQKVTPAAKQYKELSQVYANNIKVLQKALGAKGNAEKENKLLGWLRRNLGGDS